MGQRYGSLNLLDLVYSRSNLVKARVPLVFNHLIYVVVPLILLVKVVLEGAFFSHVCHLIKFRYFIFQALKLILEVLRYLILNAGDHLCFIDVFLYKVEGGIVYWFFKNSLSEKILIQFNILNDALSLKVDYKLRANSNLALHVNGTTHLLNDLLANRKPQSSSSLVPL